MLSEPDQIGSGAIHRWVGIWGLWTASIPSKQLETVTRRPRMKKSFALAALMAMVATPVAVPTVSMARDNHYDRNHHNSRDYRGRGGNYRHRCGGGNGAVGTIAGGVGGALLGSAVGGGTLGTIAGGVGGGLLGRHLDKTHSRHRNGC
jgi:outer membrane lipoprotein SlyB